jgi:hypothetical protein
VADILAVTLFEVDFDLAPPRICRLSRLIVFLQAQGMGKVFGDTAGFLVVATTKGEQHG